MTLLFTLLTLAVLGVIAAVAVGKIAGGLEEPSTSLAARGLPEGPATPEAVNAVRFSPALRGYRMEEVDAVLDRLSGELARRDRQILQLGQELRLAERAYVQRAARGAASPEWVAPGTGPIPVTGSLPVNGTPDAAGRGASPYPSPEPGDAEGAHAWQPHPTQEPAGQAYATRGYGGQGHAAPGYAEQAHPEHGFAGQGQAASGYSEQGAGYPGQADAQAPVWPDDPSDGHARPGAGYAAQGFAYAGQGTADPDAGPPAGADEGYPGYGQEGQEYPGRPRDIRSEDFERRDG